ncbi:MAG: triose-phosphate isomerase [Thermoplasmatales archaeon]|nr:triose-phosphate isomerase [Thermoplasmatales archaeon]
MKTPAIVLNFKAYTQVVGEKGIKLAKICENIAKENRVEIVVAPQMVDLGVIAKSVELPVFSQHVDPVEPGSRTGHTTPESVKGAGGAGTLINHSEMRMRIADIDFAVEKCRQLGLETIVCTNNLNVSKACALVNPDFIAVEPPELIGGDVSVTTANPEIVRNTVNAIKDINPNVKVLCGAGVKNGKDVAKALELGAEGVLLASGVVKAKNPKDVLMDLISRIK